MRDPSDGAEYGAVGAYTVVEPPHKLAFTWVWDDDPDNPQMIELEFSERDGATTVLMTHSGITTEKGRDEHEERLAEVLRQSRSHARGMRAAATVRRPLPLSGLSDAVLVVVLLGVAGVCWTLLFSALPGLRGTCSVPRRALARAGGVHNPAPIGGMGVAGVYAHAKDWRAQDPTGWACSVRGGERSISDEVV
jgi:activator of Hsp90 ATPase-like protein